MEEKKYTETELKNFGFWLGSNLKKTKNKSIDVLFNEWENENKAIEWWSIRQKAIEWWSGKSKNEQIELSLKYLSNRPNCLNPLLITGREIETIYKKEMF